MEGNLSNVYVGWNIEAMDMPSNGHFYTFLVLKETLESNRYEEPIYFDQKNIENYLKKEKASSSKIPLRWPVNICKFGPNYSL